MREATASHATGNDAPILVRDLMNTRRVAVCPRDTIRHAFRQLCALRIRHLLALPSLPFVGDLGELYLKLDDIKVRDVMTRGVITIAPEDPLEDAVEIFLRRVISALPIVDGARVVGILTETDALRALHQVLRAARRSPGDGRGDRRHG